MNKLVKRPRKFSGGGAIIKYEKPAGKMALKPLVKRSVKFVSKLPTRTRDFFLTKTPILAEAAAVVKNALAFQSDDELRRAINRQSDRQMTLNGAEQIKKGTERNGFLNIVPGGVYTIYNPETGGGETVKVQSVNKKKDNICYIDKDGFAHYTTGQMFFNLYSHYRDGWSAQNSTSSEPIVTINTEGPATTKTPGAGKYRLIQSWTNPDTGEKLTINDIAADGHVAGYSIDNQLFQTNSDEEFEAALQKFMNQKTPASAPEPTIVIGGEPEPATPPVETTLKVGQVFGNDGNKFTIAQIDENGKIHVNRVTSDDTYTDIIFEKPQDFFDRLSYEGLSNEPIQSTVEEPVVKEPVVEEAPVVEETPIVEEPVVEEKPESTVSQEPEGTTKTTQAEEKVAPKPEPTTGQSQLTAEQISDAARRELNNKGILIDLLDDAEEGKNAYSQETGKIHRYVKNKKGELVLSRGSRRTTKNEQALIDKIFDSGDGETPIKTTSKQKRARKWAKWIAGLAAAATLEETGIPAIKGELTRRGAKKRGISTSGQFKKGWDKGREYTAGHLISKAIDSAEDNAVREVNDLAPNDWNNFIDYFQTEYPGLAMDWYYDHDGKDIYKDSWDDQEMKNAYNTWKNGNQ